MNCSIFKVLVLCPLLVCFQCAQKQVAEDRYQLGEIRFDVQSSPEAESHFRKGMLLLHSFEYKDAAREFQRAREMDPDLVLAYWGEAMTHHHTLWSAQYTDEGRAVLQELGATSEERLARANSKFERELLEGVEILYAEGENPDRDKVYAGHMEAMHNAYPDNQEIAALYALSLLGAGVGDRDSTMFERSAAISRQILAENPKHPGALHYLIHAYDDPYHAIHALTAAENYAKVAPDAAHALHMPSHIFVALGMWDEVVKSNIASFDASVKRKERLDLDGDGRSFHALHWLQYGYLQQGNKEEGRRKLEDMKAYTEELPSSYARAHLVMMKATYVAETRDCGPSVAGIEVDVSDLTEAIQAQLVYTDGLCAYMADDIDGVRNAIDSIEVVLANAENEVLKSGAAMCSGVGWEQQLPSALDIGQITVMRTQLEGMAANLNREVALAEERFAHAARLEHGLTFSYGPPMIAKPSYELLGDWYLANKQEEKARRAYQTVLERAPKRRHASMAVEI